MKDKAKHIETLQTPSKFRPMLDLGFNNKLQDIQEKESPKIVEEEKVQ